MTLTLPHPRLDIGERAFVLFESALEGMNGDDKLLMARHGWTGKVTHRNRGAPNYPWGLDFGDTRLYFASSELVTMDGGWL